jgi:hypothetical protein
VILLLSYSSLIHTRRETIRSSLEQLDDVKIHADRDIKIKLILYRCRGLVFYGQCEIKFKFYGVTDSEGSGPSVFVEFPAELFGDRDARIDADGYIMTINSNNPVEIRRQANNILLRMFEHKR